MDKNILLVIDELGGLLEKYKNEIKLKDWEIERLKNKIIEIENYIEIFGRDNGKGNMEAS